MNSKSQASAQKGFEFLAQVVNVGDKVLATINGGSKFVSCYVYAIEETSVKFLWNNVVFSVEIELASMTTILIEKFNRAAIIAEIMGMVA